MSESVNLLLDSIRSGNIDPSQFEILVPPPQEGTPGANLPPAVEATVPPSQFKQSELEVAPQFRYLVDRSKKHIKVDFESIPLEPPPKDTSHITRMELEQIESTQQEAKLPPVVMKVADKDPLKIFIATCKKRGLDPFEQEAKEYSEDWLQLAFELKHKFKRRRPWEVKKEYDADFVSNKTDSTESPSYPSGHAMVGFGMASYYKAKHPALEDEWDNIAEVISHSRIQGGVHYPSDNEASKFVVEYVEGMQKTGKAKRHLDLRREQRAKYLKKEDMDKVEAKVRKAKNLPEGSNYITLPHGRKAVVRTEDGRSHIATVLSPSMRPPGLDVSSRVYEKKANDLSVLTAVPKQNLDLIMRKGLASQKAISEDPELTKAFLDQRGITEEDWRKELTDALKGFKPDSRLGASVFFSEPDPDKVSDPRHFINQFDTTNLRVNLGKLLKDIPETRFHGVELEPFNEEAWEADPDNYPNRRHRDLTTDEIASFIAKDPKELWKHYKDEYIGKYYAGDVPHGQIITPSGIIPPEYLEQVEKTSSAEEIPELNQWIKSIEEEARNRGVKDMHVVMSHPDHPLGGGSAHYTTDLDKDSKSALLVQALRKKMKDWELERGLDPDHDWYKTSASTRGGFLTSGDAVPPTEADPNYEHLVPPKPKRKRKDLEEAVLRVKEEIAKASPEDMEYSKLVASGLPMEEIIARELIDPFTSRDNWKLTPEEYKQFRYSVIKDKKKLYPVARPFALAERYGIDLGLPEELAQEESRRSDVYRNFSYPSFHTARGAFLAETARDLVPDEKQHLVDELISRIGRTRIQQGVHSHQDVEAGEALGREAAKIYKELGIKTAQDQPLLRHRSTLLIRDPETGKLLAAKEEDPSSKASPFYFPGGGTYEEEYHTPRTPSEAELLEGARREALEELGLAISNAKVVGSYGSELEDWWKEKTLSNRKVPYKGVMEHYILADKGKEDSSLYNIEGDAFELGKYYNPEEVYRALSRSGKSRTDTFAPYNREQARVIKEQLLNKRASLNSDFKPDFTPKQLKELGVFDQVYGDAPSEASMKEWPDHWIHKQDPLGWLQWYERYAGGRRSEDDERQIKRWKSFKARHLAQYLKNPTPRRAAALRNWGIDVSSYEKTAKAKKPKGTATKRNPKKWAAAKSRAKAKMGGKWSARAAQLAVKYYKDSGGKYSGKKPTAKNNKLKKWTKQDWQWSGERKKKAMLNEVLVRALTEFSKEAYGRKKKGKGVYLPAKSIDALKSTKKGRNKLKAATRKKTEATRKGEQHASHGLHKGKNRSKLSSSI